MIRRVEWFNPERPVNGTVYVREAVMPRYRNRETGVEVMARQVRVDNWKITTDWCDGWPTLVNGSQGVLVTDGNIIIGHASLGDYVVQTATGFHPADAGTFNQQFTEL